MKIARIAVRSLCFVAAVATLPAAGADGTVVSLRGGSLERHEGGAWRQTRAGARVSTGERLRTGKDAVAVIELPAVGRFVIGPASEVELGRDPSDFEAKVSRGALWLQTAPQRRGRTAMSTPIAIAGVRGTSFAAVFGEAEQAICYCTCTGSIEVSTRDGKAVTVGRGEYVAIPRGSSAPPAAQPSAPVMASTGTVFDFCLGCHVVGGKGELKPGWR